ncbi:MAG: hypothetical protein LBV42_03585 [Methanobrevibacter sp.]|jgi:hypothetical protein|nr:hypothetical protein [Methanobrevibacter sp.]
MNIIALVSLVTDLYLRVFTPLANCVAKIISSDNEVQVGKAGARGVIVINRVKDCVSNIKSIGANKLDVGNSAFGIIRDTVGMLCTVAELVCDIKKDEVVDNLNDELEYRKSNGIHVNNVSLNSSSPITF